jgi:hypothetical protein
MSAFIDEIRDWLDTETRAILFPKKPEKLVALDIDSYSLLLLNSGNDERRIQDVVAEIRKIGPTTSINVPFVIGRQLSLEDALAGQFALACCDCVTAFVRDKIVQESPLKVYRQLHREVMSSPEFTLVDVLIESIPNTHEGRRLGWQFFGLATGVQTPKTIRMFRKKARLLEHWAKKVNAIVRVCDNDTSKPQSLTTES